MSKQFQIVLLFLLIVSQQILAQRVQHVDPQNKIKNYVTDKTGTLTSSQLSALETKLSGFDKQTSTQIVVYMMSSLDGGSLEDKSIDIAEQNGIGKKSKNNGVLLFIVKDDRKLRIEVGYGLEGALTDAISDQIIRKEITPYFKNGQYYEGINAGVDAIILVTKGEYKNDDKTNNNTSPNGLICGLPFIAVFIFFMVGLFILRVIFSIIGRAFGHRRGWFGGGTSGWFWGGGGGSSWSGGSSFGGFSGGGGSFGGGGASGSW